LLKDVWKPDVDFKFPKDKHNTTFEYHWFAEFSWLVYSKILDGAFCLFCVLFGSETSERNSSWLKKLYREPYRNWKKALGNFREHENKSPIHKLSLERQLAFCKVFILKSKKSIGQERSEVLQGRVDKNIKKLKVILQTVLFCGMQNIPLHGHRDDNKYLLVPCSRCLP